MSQLAYYMERQCLVPSWTIALVLASFFAFCIPAQGTETDDKTELAERKEFIEKAMEEAEAEREKAREETSREMTKRGIPKIVLEEAATLVPFGDGDFYFVKGGCIRWKPNVSGRFQQEGQPQEGQPNVGHIIREVKVPVGFVMDLASIPRIFWQVHRPEERYAYAAVVHDYLYWTQTRPREEADQILRIAMEDSKVDPVTVATIYQAVRHFGQAAWDNNARLKKSGERRILNRYPLDFTVSWSDWKKRPDVFGDEETCHSLIPFPDPLK